VSKVFVYFLETRPNFLLLTLSCSLVGVGTALWSGVVTINGWYLLVALLGALAAHIAVNVLNDYFDFISGLDKMTMRTPFSGGSGILPAGRMSPKSAFVFGLVALMITVTVGLYFVFVYGWDIFLVGVPGVILVVFYTQFITRKPWFCLFAPGLGFGPCMVLGIHYVLTGSYNWVALVASIVPLFLVSNLLLLNQFPDAEPDKVVGRCHLPVLFGLKKSAWIYCAILLGCYVWIVIAVLADFFPVTALIALLTAPLALITGIRVRSNAENVPGLIPLLGWNVIVTLGTIILLAVGLIIPVL